MEFFIEWGYLGLFFASFLSATILPLSSEFLLSAMIATHFELLPCLAIATIGNWLGGMSSYGFGWLGKWEILEKYFRVRRQKIEQFKNKIDRWGSLIALFCWLPFLGDPLAIGLGFFRISIYKVSFWMFVGKLCRYLAWAGITYWGVSFL